MKGLEMMLANMIGVSPTEMKAMFDGLMTSATTGVETMQRIEAQNAEILALLKGKQNDGADGAS